MVQKFLLRRISLILFIVLIIIGSACAPNVSVEEPELSPTQIVVNTSTTIVVTASITQTSVPPTNMVTPTIDFTATSTPTSDADGCRKPSNNYDLININGHLLNTRTFEMLQYAQLLYSGWIEITDYAITQGSYSGAVEASFGTHSGGGAVDLSVIAKESFTVLYEEIEPLIHALRLSGFAAWFRDFDDLYDGSPVHIHAIAIGDQELSPAARAQLIGPHGYFWGFDGLPMYEDVPSRDPHGGPLICDWMIALGYPEKTATSYPRE